MWKNPWFFRNFAEFMKLFFLEFRVILRHKCNSDGSSEYGSKNYSKIPSIWNSRGLPAVEKIENIDAKWCKTLRKNLKQNEAKRCENLTKWILSASRSEVTKKLGMRNGRTLSASQVRPNCICWVWNWTIIEFRPRQLLQRRLFINIFVLIVKSKDYKGVSRLASKIKDEGFEADLYTKHCCTCTLCTVQYKHTGWIESCHVLASFCG